MNDRLHSDMIEATRLTRAGRLAEATSLLQRLLRQETTPNIPSGSIGDGTDAFGGRAAPLIIDAAAERIDPEKVEPAGHQAEETVLPQMPRALRSFLTRVSRIGSAFGANGTAMPSPEPVPHIVTRGGQFLDLAYSNEAGSRAYKLYVPSSYTGQALPLVVMLHGCTQSPDDFAAGTRMNMLAEDYRCLVAYPAQSASANISKCWNWFSPGDQRRGQGEPSLIAGITHQIMSDYAVDPRRVYVAGLSAGAAAAAILGMNYPDLYTAIGVHSGLACGAARDLPSAFAAMRKGDPGALHRAGSAWSGEERRRIVPTIVFHGDQDNTVHPGNGDYVITQSRATVTMDLRTSVQQGQAPGGHAYSRTLHTDASGQAILEQWVIHGGGHAWSGGSTAGSYTDPCGPDASREMLRFFFEHSHPAPGSGRQS